MSTGTTISSEGLSERRRRLLFRCWHRGIREMDLILGRFADAHIATLPDSDLDELERLLDVPDQEIYGWVNGERHIPASFATPLFASLRAFNGAASGTAR